MAPFLFRRKDLVLLENTGTGFLCDKAGGRPCHACMPAAQAHSLLFLLTVHAQKTWLMHVVYILTAGLATAFCLRAPPRNENACRRICGRPVSSLCKPFCSKEGGQKNVDVVAATWAFALLHTRQAALRRLRVRTHRQAMYDKRWMHVAKRKELKALSLHWQKNPRRRSFFFNLFSCSQKTIYHPLLKHKTPWPTRQSATPHAGCLHSLANIMKLRTPVAPTHYGSSNTTPPNKMT